MPFSQLGIAPAILAALKEAGHTEPTPIQSAAIPPILAGKDLIGIAQTGTGKTAAFVLPMLTRLSEARGSGTRVLILAPTRELVVQIEENVRAYARHLSLSIATVFGGVGERPQIAALKAGADLLIATPGRLLDLIGQGHGNFSGLKYLVLDEADRMLDMGFIPDIRRIVRALPRKRQTLLFSATLSREIEQLTHEFLHQPQTVEIGHRANPAETVAQAIYEVPAHLKPALLSHLLADPALEMVIVFTRTKYGAEKVGRVLARAGITAATLHSNRSQNQRLRAMNDFRSGAVRVLVATDIAARGIDVDGISHVINYDFPMHAEDYIHRIGRTGRAQAVGDAISFVTPEDRAPLRTLERFIGRGVCRKQAEGFDLKVPAPPKAENPASSRERGGRSPSRPRGGDPGKGGRAKAATSGPKGTKAETAGAGRGRSKASPGRPDSSRRGKGAEGGAAMVKGVPGGRTWRPGR